MTEFGYRSESTSAPRKRMEAGARTYAKNKRQERVRKALERAIMGDAARVALQGRRKRAKLEEAMALAATGAARLLYEPRPQLSMREIVLEVAAKHAVLASLIMSESRSRPIVAARQECFWRSRHELGFALTKIARFFHRDHTSVLHGERKHGLTAKPAEVPFA